MTTSYVTYTCTFCRRSKSLIKDDRRAVPDQCTITKGCLGRLYVSGYSDEQTSTPSVAGLQDWKPRGTPDVNVQLPPEEKFISLATAESGAFTIAIKSDTDPGYSTITLTFEQRKSSDASFQLYLYRTSGATSQISGRDQNGRNLRFDSLAVEEDRIVVRVNGVQTTDVILVPSIITFETLLPANAIVEILVYAEKTTTEQTIELQKNNNQIPSLVRGAWSNIKKVQRNKVSESALATSWWIYSTNGFPINSGKIKVLSLSSGNDAVFLLAAPPFESVDRYLNFVVPIDSLQDDFWLNSIDGKLTVDSQKLEEIYPPLIINQDAYISEDLFTASTGAIDLDTPEKRITSSKILGPM